METLKRKLAIATLILVWIGGSLAAQPARKAVSSPAPAYPPLARQMHLTGLVKVKVVIAPEGQITKTEFQGGNPVFIDAVQATLKEWKYAPANYESTLLLEFKF
jgi:outer membrane biosynthesis protein TonB